MNAQQLIIGHLLPITAGIVVLWLVYRLLFSNSNRLQFNRLFLISAMLFSLALPFIGLQMGQSAPQVVHLKQNMLNGTMLGEITVMPEGETTLPEVEVAPDAPQKVQINGWRILGGIYLIGVGVMALLFLFKIAKLVVLIIRSPKEKRDGYTAVFLSKVPEPVEGPTSGSFSFFRYAFFPNENVPPDIVRHERSHIAHGHSWDILFVEAMMVLQWFNPFIYLYKKELQSLHEYQADRDVVATGVDKRNYMMLILQQCTATNFSGMSNNFSLILTKKRIKMITKNEKAKGLWWRLLATLPALAMLLIANTKVTAQEQSCQINVPQMTEPVDSYKISLPDVTDDGTLPVNDTVVYNPDGSYTEVKHETKVDPATNESRTTVTFARYDKDGNPKMDGFTIKPEEHNGKKVIKVVPNEGTFFGLTPEKDNDSIFQIVDQMPEFPGGTDEMMHFVASNIKYPQDAIDEGKGGRVFVSFVVEKDGLVSNVKVLRGVCESIDEEAARVVRGMPRWKPGMKDGKPARVSFQMPITFNLGQTNGEHKTTVRTVIAEDESGEHSRKVSTATYPDNPVEDKMQPDKDGVFQIVEEMPQFPGGEPKLMEYVAKNLNYPQEARDKGIDGRVFIGMVIEKDGSVSNVKVLRGIGGGCDEEAVRVISSMPKWKPGKIKGEPVPVSYQIPINFKLTGQQPKKN